MKIKLEVSPLVASCLQRMIADEIDNQKQWIRFPNVETRKRIIREMGELADTLEKQGIAKHIKCY